MSSPVFNLPPLEKSETGPYALVGKARAKSGKAEELEAVLIALVAPTRSEAGALQYHVHRDRADPDLFVFYEVWKSVAHLHKHLSQPYIQTFLENRHSLLAEDMDVTWLRMASTYDA